jgi:hypothetical protein
MTELIQSAYVVDGKTFATKKEAQDYLRRPKITEALKAFISGNDDLVTWIVENQEGVEVAFETGTIKRVTKREQKDLEKALEAIKGANNPAFKFVADNAEAVASSFRWPSVKRMDDDAKAAAALEALVTLAGGNEGLAQFVVTNKDKVLNAFEAGKTKRQVSEKALSGLAAYHAEMKARKEAAKADEAAPAE